MEATSPVSCIEGGVLVNLCEQRSDERGSGCDAPAEIYKLPTSAGESCKAAEGFPTPGTSPLRSPKPPRTKIKQYAWRNSAKKEVCMYIRILKPLEIRKEEELEPRHIESTNCQKRSGLLNLALYSFVICMCSDLFNKPKSQVPIVYYCPLICFYIFAHICL